MALSTLLNIIRTCDIYSTKYTMRINSQSNFKTKSGGVLSIFTVAFLVFCFYFFGLDFYNRENPLVFDEIKLRKEPILLNSTNINNTKPFAILRKTSMFNKYKFVYIQGQANNEKLFQNNKIYLPMCDNDVISNLTVNLEFSGSEFQCIDLSLVYMATDSWSFSQLRLEHCDMISEKDRKEYGYDCDGPDIRDEISIMNFQILMPKIYFDALDYNNALQEEYLYVQISLGRSVFTFYDLEIISSELEDDKGWIIKDIERSLKIGLKENLALQTNTIPNPTKKFNFVLNFVLIKEYLKYTRIYSKIQNLFALVGGFMKIIVVISEFINLLSKIYFIDMFFIRNSFQMNENTIYEDDNLSENRKENNNFAVVDNNNISNINNLDHTNMSKLDKSEKELFRPQNDKSQRIEGGFWNYIKANINIVLGKRIKKSDSYKSEVDYKLQTAIEITDKMREVEYTLQKLHELELVKMMILNSDQITAMGLVEKPILGKNKESYIEKIMKNYESLIEDDKAKEDAVVHYFFELLIDSDNNKLSDKDNILLTSLRESTRKKIYDEYNKHISKKPLDSNSL